MNKYATRKQNIFNPKSKTPFELSRSKIEMFLQCPRCFYLDRRLGVAPPRTAPFNLNEAVDLVLKNEFDRYRRERKVHPLVAEAGLDLIPLIHERLDVWRNPFDGIRYHHQESNFIVYGGIDDVWTDAENVISIVDYKATSKLEEVNIDAPWQQSYKNQIEIYQWLFKKNEFQVSDTGYFVYANGDRTYASFDNALHFTTKLISYTGKTDWVDKTLLQARKCLSQDAIPEAGKWCDLCKYRQAAGKSFQAHAHDERN